MARDDLERALTGGPPLWREIREDRLVSDRPYRVANAVLRRLGIRTPPVDVDDVAAALGATVYYHHRHDDVSGAVLVTGDRAIIEVAASESEQRQRFTLAHELGHLLLHDVRLAHRDTSYQRRDPMEIEANAFAAALLVPKWMLETYVKSGRDIPRAAQLFDVSEAAMRIQVAKLLGVPVELL